MYASSSSSTYTVSQQSRPLRCTFGVVLAVSHSQCKGHCVQRGFWHANTPLPSCKLPLAASREQKAESPCQWKLTLKNSTKLA